MKRPALVLVFLALSLLAACQSTQQKEQEFLKQVSSWKGKSEKDLINQLGTPNRTYELSGTKYITYASLNYQTTSLYCTNSFTGGRVSCNGGEVLTLTCEVTFNIEKGIITGGSYKGNNCY